MRVSAQLKILCCRSCMISRLCIELAISTHRSEMTLHTQHNAHVEVSMLVKYFNFFSPIKDLESKILHHQLLQTAQRVSNTHSLQVVKHHPTLYQPITAPHQGKSLPVCNFLVSLHNHTMIPAPTRYFKVAPQ
jgi:hypothetical protein